MILQTSALTLVECSGRMTINHITHKAHEVAGDGKLPMILVLTKPEGDQHGYDTGIA